MYVWMCVRVYSKKNELFANAFGKFQYIQLKNTHSNFSVVCARMRKYVKIYILRICVCVCKRVDMLRA